MTEPNLADIPGSSITVEAERDPAALVRDGPERTLSNEALSQLIAQMGGWVASRLLRAMDDGHPPQRVTVSIHVELDGRPAD